jgi:chromosome partitioning protein
MSAYDMMVDGESDLSGYVYRTSIEGLSVIPSKINLAKLESKLVGDFDAPFRLKDRLEHLREEFDAIFIDTPPTLGLITVNALVAATHVLIPIQSSYFALEGTDDLLETIEKVKARPNPNLRVLGVVVTLFDKRTTLAREVFEQIRNVFGTQMFETVITKSVRLEEAPAYRESIFSFAPQSSGAFEYAKLCEEVIGRV